MKKRGKRCLFLLLLIISSSLVLSAGLDGKVNQMKLLAVQQGEKGYEGSIADLYLELKEGTGRVFLDTFPLTKMDTQISTRFAKEIACDYIKDLTQEQGKDRQGSDDNKCKKYDFIYTIKADSNIIGGPSAGAAMAALTVVSLLDLRYDDKITVTGTINSGGIIGQVGGVKEKLEAAANNSLKKILIAKGGSLTEGNKTTDLVEFARKNLSLDVSEISNLNELMLELTGLELKKNNISIEISPEYQEIMKELSNLLCRRSEELEKELKGFRINKTDKDEIEKKKNSSRDSLEKEDYYSASSFCFGANIIMRNQLYKNNKDQGWQEKEIVILRKKAELIEEKIKKEEIKTMTDLQTLMIVRERLNEVRERLDEAEKSEEKTYLLAYAEERFFSAISWMYFFKMKGKEFELDKERLKESCRQKISESEERHQYVELIWGEQQVSYIKEKIELAKRSLEEGREDLCLMKAIQGKAEADAILSSMGLGEENLDSYLESKKEAVRRVIAKSSMEGIFPILGYSYYQYANTLGESEKGTALLYLEYALEMSDLDIYFEEKEEERVWGVKLAEEINWLKRNKEWLKFGEGMAAGILIMLLAIQGGRLLRKRRAKRKL